MKRQPPVMQRKNHESGVNKKAIIWTASLAGALVILMAVLLIVNR